jgi:cytoplasmic iron level regulating protein YaaA (DUF328/UPF0246 family)
MYILLAPSQTKNSGGTGLPYTLQSFSFPQIYHHRLEAVGHYERFIHSQTIDDLGVWFGIKDNKQTKKYIKYFCEQPTMKAVQRYTGVAYDALDYNGLSTTSQRYIDEHVLIFSDLFGVLMAKDMIPCYRFKQGAKLPDIDIVKHYKTDLKECLDRFLDHEVLDLRAGYYDRYYKPIASVVRYKFLKNGKSVSHWAKHYRGKLTRDIAMHKVQNFQQLTKLELPYLETIDIQTKQNIKTIVVEVL